MPSCDWFLAGRERAELFARSVLSGTTPLTCLSVRDRDHRRPLAAVFNQLWEAGCVEVLNSALVVFAQILVVA